MVKNKKKKNFIDFFKKLKKINKLLSIFLREFKIELAKIYKA
jgi:translation initiation factor 2 alpha subunit (eIF-2alpha)